MGAAGPTEGPADIGPISGASGDRLVSAILEGAPDATVVVDADGVIWYANRQVAALFGWDADDLLGQPLDLLVPPAVRQAHERHLHDYFSSPSPRPMGIARIVHGLHRDGHQLALEVSLSPIELPQGLLVAASARDASNHVRLARSMLADRDHVVALLDALADGVVEYALDEQRVVHVNRAFCELLGLSPAEVLGRPPGEWLPVDRPPLLDELVTAARDRATVHLRIVLRRDDGTEVPVQATASPITNAVVPPHVALVVRDLTEDERIGAELADVRSLVQIADERDRIARDLHDRVIQRLFAAGLHLEAAVDRDDTRDRVLAVVDEIDAAITEIRSSIFTLHRPRGLHGGLEHALNAAIDEAARLLDHRPELTLRGAWRRVPEDVVAEVSAVVRELLSNVVKHAGSERTWVTVVVDDVHLSVTVEDDGVGMVQPPRSTGGDGLRNLTERAAQRGGRTVVEEREPVGTIVNWTIPLGG